MTESETEDETLERLERALRAIAEMAAAPLHATLEPGFDRTAVLQTLDTLIARLRAGLAAPSPAPNNPHTATHTAAHTPKHTPTRQLSLE